MALSHRDIPEKPARDLELRMFERCVDALLVLWRLREGGKFPFPDSFDPSMIAEVLEIYADVGWKSAAPNGACLVLAPPEEPDGRPRG